MTPHDSIVTACTHLGHWWELHGPAADPQATIHRIATAAAPARHGQRQQLEDTLFMHWALLCAEGGDDDYAL